MQRLQIRIAVFFFLSIYFGNSDVVAQLHLEVITDTIPGTDIHYTMVGLQGGTFLIGTPEDEEGRDEDEGPESEVFLSPFYIGIHEVTYDEFLLFSSSERDSPEGAPGTEFDPELIARPSPPYEDPAHGMGTNGYPAVGMTQWSALQYARWLSIKTGKFHRLPTEAEWEYACRADTSSAFGFGETVDSLDVYAWYYGNSDEAYHQVGKKAANRWGIYDMHGNVAEWTLDEYRQEFYEELEGSASENPWSIPTRLHPRTVRGGAYDDSANALRCGARLRSDLDWKRRDPQIPRSMWWNTDSPFVGFRIVRPFAQPTPDEQQEFWAIVLGG
ncbi:MAG: SUMF1/EgtB/PvdO family nonheme iron enzyme [Bacteroidetes bacterium]|nr:SUMF1/EgtB/PvdO family nonheme iron enzyme [Bacteroidota bacterium]MCY4204377.1 SUMF1/EgtB/PvdO family nonheme iron enzyme [Bacteroidota bacterium]